MRLWTQFVDVDSEADVWCCALVARLVRLCLLFGADVFADWEHLLLLTSDALVDADSDALVDADSEADVLADSDALVDAGLRS